MSKPTIEEKRVLSGPGDSPVSPLRNNGSVPKELKLIPEKHKKLENLTDNQDVIPPHNHEALDRNVQITNAMRKQEGVGYPCGNYSYSISDEESLKEIQGTERNEKYRSCAQCGYITNWKNNLVSHLQTHHGKSGDEKQIHHGESGGEMQHETN